MSNAKSPKTLTAAQVQDLLDALHESSYPVKTYIRGLRNYLIACLMLDAGLRVGEVVKIKSSHLMFRGEAVKTLILTTDITKNHKQRAVHVNSRLSHAIFDFFYNSPELLTGSQDVYVFTSAKSTNHVTTRQVELIINKASMSVLGFPVHPHMLRHTFGSNLMRVTNLRTVQELLGHSCLSSTQVYTHPNADDKKKAIVELESQLPPDPDFGSQKSDSLKASETS